MAYNRDEAETYNLEKEIRAGLMEMYSLAPDVFDKKIKLLDKQIQDDAIDLANKNIEKAKSKLQQMAEKKEEEKDDLVQQMAKLILEENQDYIGEDIAQEAIKELEKQIAEQEQEENKKKSTKGRKTKKEGNKA